MISIDWGAAARSWKYIRQIATTFCVIMAVVPVVTARAGAPVNVVTYHNDNLRSGQNLNETILTPANVNSTGFGKVFSYPVDGAIYAEPLYVSGLSIAGGVHDVVYVATEHDSVYAFDAAGGGELWQVSFINPPTTTTVSPGDVICSDLVPEIGITGTPVIDLAKHTLYVVSKVKTASTGAITQALHALDLATGAEKFGGPVTINATVHGDASDSVNNQVSFNPLTANQRSALLLASGKVYIAFASHCDIPPYHGWVLGYDAGTLKPHGVFNTTPTGTMGGIWQSGNGPAEFGGFIFVGVGNGTFNANASGRDYGDSFVRLNPVTLRVKSYFTPSDQHQLAIHDADNGSTGPVIIPNQNRKPRFEMMGGGKDGTLYILNGRRMGGFCPPPCDDKQVVEALNSGQFNGLYSPPAYWNGFAYVISSLDVPKEFTLSNGLLSRQPIAHGLIDFGFEGAGPVVSSNGTSDGIVWALNNTGGRATPAVLYAFDATDVSNELYDSSQAAGGRDTAGEAVKFAIPTVANGRVYVGTQSELDVYGLLN